MEFSRKIIITTPYVPDYIIDSSDNSIPIGDFTETELREIGAAWVEELVQKAARKHKELE